VSRNWWHNTINCQFHYARLLVVFGDFISAEHFNILLARLKVPGDVPQERRTGQNLLWYATQQLVRGVVSRSRSDIDRSKLYFDYLTAYSEGEGLKQDFSFQQHSKQLYSAGYGLQFYIDMVERVSWLESTSWALDKSAIRRLMDFGEKGIAPLIRGKWIDWGARGREFSRREAFGRRTAEFRRASQRLASVMGRKDPFPEWQGSWHYWQSEFFVHQSKSWYVSVKLPSSQTVATESGNGENLLGYWLGFGATLFITNDRQYAGILNSFDWSRVPGVTSLKFVPRFQGYLSNRDSFSCGIHSGSFAALGMSLRVDGISAKKAWFLLDDQLVCLGAGITSTVAAHTTVDQCPQNGGMSVDGLHFRELRVHRGRCPATVVHDDFQYDLVQGSSFEIRYASGVGNDGRHLNTAMPPDDPAVGMLSIVLEHNQSISDRYVYSVSPVSLLSGSPRKEWRVLFNDDEFQAIVVDGASCLLGVCRAPRAVKFGSVIFYFEQPGAFVVSLGDGMSVTLEFSPPLSAGSLDLISMKYEVHNLSGVVSLVRQSAHKNVFLGVIDLNGTK